jgi:mono/diheme cytochrome c family protein
MSGAALGHGVDAFQAGNHAEAYHLLLPAAEDGDAEAQNVIGFLLVKGGTGIEADGAAAHRWFHRAAEQGLTIAWRNIAVLHAGEVAGVEADFAEANAAMVRYLAARKTGQAIGVSGERLERELELMPAGEAASREAPERPAALEPDLDDAALAARLGERTFVSFCAGCHGKDGNAAYPPAPSFALDERLEFPDSRLMESILNGKGDMPPWRGKLPEAALAKALSYMRTLSLRAKYDLRAPEPGPYRFQFRPVGSGEANWFPDQQ